MRNNFAAIGADGPNLLGSAPIRDVSNNGKECFYETTEYIGSVYVPSTSAVGDVLFSSPLSPLLLPGTRLFAEGSQWEQWSIIHWEYKFRTVQNQMVTGQLMSFVDPDPKDTWSSNPQNLNRASSQWGAEGRAVYKDYTVPYPKSGHRWLNQVFYTNPTNTSDERFSNAGYLKIVNAGGFNFASQTMVYQVFMHCKVKFFKPELTLTTLTPSSTLEVVGAVSDINKLFQAAAVKSGIPVELGADGSIGIDTSTIGGHNIFLEGSAFITNLLGAAMSGRFDLGTGTGAGVLDWGYDPTIYPGSLLDGTLTEVTSYGQALLSGEYSWLITPAIISTVGGLLGGRFSGRRATLNINLVPSAFTALDHVYGAFKGIRQCSITAKPRTSKEVGKTLGGHYNFPKQIELPSNELATFGSTASWQQYTRGSINATGPIPLFSAIQQIPLLTTDIRDGGLQVSPITESSTYRLKFTCPLNSFICIMAMCDFTGSWTGPTAASPTLTNMSAVGQPGGFTTLTTSSGAAGNTAYRFMWCGTSSASVDSDVLVIQMPEWTVNITTTGIFRCMLSVHIIQAKTTSNTHPALNLRVEKEEDTTDDESEEESPVSPEVPRKTKKNNSFSPGDDMSSEGFVSVVCDKKVKSVKKV